MSTTYCRQNDGVCQTCSLVNYGRDCHNNAVAIITASDNDGTRCQCGRPVIHCDQHYPNYVGARYGRIDACKRNGE